MWQDFFSIQIMSIELQVVDLKQVEGRAWLVAVHAAYTHLGPAFVNKATFQQQLEESWSENKGNCWFATNVGLLT